MKRFDNLTDPELIQMYLKGNNEAFATIVMRYKDKMYTAIYLMVKDRYEAEDILQNVFISIIEALKKGRYNDEKKFLSWAMRIAHNNCINHFRKVKRNPVIANSGNRDIAEVFSLNEPGADNKIIHEESHKKIRMMIDTLPEDQREVIILRHFADLSFKEIAGLTKCSINTALGRMRYALINLRRLMEEKQMAL